MNMTYENNLKALSENKRYELLYKTLCSEQTINEMQADEDFSCEVTEIEGNTILYVLKEGKTFQLDSLYSGKKAIDIWFESQITLTYMAKCLFCGLGNGMYVDKLLSDADETVTVCVYEPSLKIFIKALEYFDLRHIISSNRVTLIVKDLFECDAVSYIYKFINYHDIENAIFQAYPNYSKIMPGIVRDFDRKVQEMVMQIRATQSVIVRYGRENAVNSLQNMLPFIKSKSIMDFNRLCPKDVPAFVVASGPSLNKNIEELKRAKGKSLIVAVDSAIPTLLRNDIVPDLFVTLDSKKDIRHTEDERSHTIPCFCELESNAAIVAKQTGALFFMNDMSPYVNAFINPRDIIVPPFSTGGSVANSACAILLSMGFNNIILVGQDLAYTDNKTHASGTVGASRNTDVGELEDIMVDAYYGGKIKSSNEFILYKKWFEEAIINNPEATIVDATEGGALIRGAINMPLAQAVDTYCEKNVDIAAVVDASEYLMTKEQQSEMQAYMLNLYNLYEKWEQEMREALRGYDGIEKLVREGKIASGQMKKLLAKTGEIVERMEKAPEMYYVFCFAQMALADEGLIEDIYKQYDSLSEEIMETITRSRRYVEILKEKMKYLVYLCNEKFLVALKEAEL